MIYDNIVIGSGISALGCVVGLLESNKKILCIDGSDNTLESFKNINNEEIVFDNDNLYTKKNGKISKFKNVYIIDSSNFKNIPAGDISLTIMANALRIAVENKND